MSKENEYKPQYRLPLHHIQDLEHVSLGLKNRVLKLLEKELTTDRTLEIVKKITDILNKVYVGQPDKLTNRIYYGCYWDDIKDIIAEIEAQE